MTELVTLALHPPVHDPVLVVVLEGWIDAGAAATTAMQTILEAHGSELVASFDTDTLLDHRARRPVMSLVEGQMTALTWPSIELRALTDEQGRHVLVLVGAEPDHEWRRFTDAVVDLALELGVSSVIGLGAYPAAVPHTRDTHLALTSPSLELLDSFTGFVRGTVEVPGGIQASIEHAASVAGIPSIGLWAQVPHYISGMPYAPAALALVEGLQRISELELQSGVLAAAAHSGRSHLDELVSSNPQHQAMITQLEEIYDATDIGPSLEQLPTGDELAAEFQACRREQGD